MAGSLVALLLLAVPGSSRAAILYVTNYGNDTIEEFSSSGVGTLFASVPSSVALSEPVALAFDSGANLYEGYAYEDGAIEKYYQSGGVLSSNGTVFASAGLDEPFGLAFDSAGNLYAANYYNNTIEKFNSSGAGTLFANAGLAGPSGLAFDSAGNLYVANYDNDTIKKYNSSGVGTVFANAGLNAPFGLAFDGAGNLYVSNVGNNSIVEFNSSGGVLSSNATVFASAGLDAPLGLVFDSNGNLYVANFSNNSIVEFNSSGGVLSSNATVFANSGLDEPYALAFQPVGVCTYTINRSTSPAGGGTTSGGGTVNCGSNVTVCASPNPCRSFVNWTDQNSNVVSTSACYSFAPTNSETLVANFVVVFPYTITTSSSPAAGGSTTGDGMAACGSNATVCATANPCYSFVNWTDQNSNVFSTSACITFTVTNSETFVANFTSITNSITTSSSPTVGGSTSGGGTVLCGSNVTVCASVNASCYSFANWTVNGTVVSASACYSFTATNSETFVANFTPLAYYTITTSSSPAGGGSTSGGGTVACGSNVTVCATISPCYTFVNWTDPNSNVVSTSTCYSFTAVSNETLVANFASLSYGNFISLHAFDGTDGADSQAALIQGSDGNFYGTTYDGGPDYGGGAVGYGTVFRVTPSGVFTTLWSFANSNDGAHPYGPLVQASDGYFYGTTYGAGFGALAAGTLFRITPSGNLTNLWTFTGGSDGGQPVGPLAQGSDGNLYGTASSGGANGNGTVFRITTGGSLTPLWSFPSSNGQGEPWGGLVQGGDGNFYGTTEGGGSGVGTVFRISPSGSYTNLHSFMGNDGAYPYSGLAPGADGNFYGTTLFGGPTYTGGATGNGTVFRISPSGILTNLYAFGGSDGSNPNAGLTQCSDGNFYGTTDGGGTANEGTVFRITPGGFLTNLWEFYGCNDGGYAFGGVVEGSDGNIYGTTTQGRNQGFGTVFRIDIGLCFYRLAVSSLPPTGGIISGGGIYSCGSNVTVCATPNPCYSFVNWTDPGSNVLSTSTCYGLTAASNMTLLANFAPISFYIITSSSPSGGGSTSGGGTVACASNVTVCATPNPCYNFVNWTDQNSNVVSTSACYGFTAASNVALVANFSSISMTTTYYTITATNFFAAAGSVSGGVTVPCGSNVTVCATPNGCFDFVNWTLNGNAVSTSACYTFAATNTEILVANFQSISSGTIITSSSPSGGGSTSGGGMVACGSNVTVCATAKACYSFANWIDQNSNVVSTSACYSFTAAGNENLVANFAVNGGAISGSLTSLWSFAGASDGANPEGALIQGSDGDFYSTTYGSGSGPSGFGSVFRLSPSGSLTNLHSFTGSDGANPSAALVQGSDSNFYGTTYQGGANGYGTVFRISPSGSLTTLWSFTSGLDGANSFSALVQGSDGNFYGTTSQGGASGDGTVFRITASGSLSNLHTFVGSDGANPSAGLLQGSDGNFYGTTYADGNNFGTVFRITASGSLTTLWSFTNGLDGANSYAPLVQGEDGNFYGTTSQGGANGNGTVFRISPTGNLTNLWEFTGCGDGGIPYAGLMQGSDGNFYGTTSGSGSGPSGYGTVFRISPSGDLATLHSFSVGDGANPYAGLVQGSDGSFYGTTYQGGMNGNHGTVFRLTILLSPPANQISGIQLMGTSLVLTIPSVAGETYQLQYSDSLTLSNWSNVGGVSMTNSIGGSLSLTNFGGALQPQGFYRFDITP
jgi:uncharacterized repeat protein (TIGR03803 family)